MRASDDNVPSQRSVLERILIRSWEYRHLRFWAGYRIVAGIIVAFCGVATLWVGAYRWAALFLVPAALLLAFGYWEMTIAYRLLYAPLPQRVRELEQSRSRVVDDSAAGLRRIERDLHDGAQAQLVAVSMKLGLATKKLGGMVDGTGQTDLDRVLELVSPPTAAPRRPSPSCVTWPGASTPRRSTKGLAPPSPPSPPAATCPSSWSLTCPSARRRRSRPSPTSAPPSCWPTPPSTAARSTSRWRPRTCPGCCGYRSQTMASAAPASMPTAAWPGLPSGSGP